jgi:hypothetical protein
MNRPVRILLPWFERREAITALLGFRMPSREQEADAASKEYDAARAALATRLPCSGEAPEVEPPPPEIADAAASLLKQLQASPWEKDRPCNLRVAVVNLRQVVAFQKAISLDGVAERVATVAVDDWRSLAALCLPNGDRIPEDELRGTFDKDERGMTITSLNPNLRASSVRPLGQRSGAHVFGVEVVFGTPFVHVVEYQGRLFLRDGCHRTFGLLARGLDRVPCIVERGTSPADIHGGGTSFIGRETLLGPQPPFLTDFHDPAYSRTVEQQCFRKVVRIRVEEFVIPV